MKDEKFTPNPKVDQDYDRILVTELEKRLKRKAKPNELINADNDSDLVNEALWQLITELANRIEFLEKKSGIININNQQ